MEREIAEWKTPCYLCKEEYNTVNLNSYGLGSQAVVLCTRCGKEVSDTAGKQMLDNLGRISNGTIRSENE